MVEDTFSWYKRIQIKTRKVTQNIANECGLSLSDLSNENKLNYLCAFYVLLKDIFEIWIIEHV